MDHQGYDGRSMRSARQPRSVQPADGRDSQQGNPDAIEASGRRVFGQRGTITSRPSRESIMRSYAAQDEARARSARMRSQESYKNYQAAAERNRERLDRKRELEMRIREEERLRADERRRQFEMDQARLRSETARGQREGYAAARRVVEPLSSQESHERSERSRAFYEREREYRDALSPARPLRGGNREVIDGRGSIDSRAFSERHDLVSYSIDESDKPDPMIDGSNPKAKWHSHAASDVSVPRGMLGRRGTATGPAFSSGLSQKRTMGIGSPFADLPPFVKVVVPLIVVLLIVLLVIVFL